MKKDLTFLHLTPPDGGVEKLLQRMVESPKSFTKNVRVLVASSMLTLAAGIALYLVNPKEDALSQIITASNDLVVYKYGFKRLPADNLQLSVSDGRTTLTKTEFGYELSHH